MDLMTGYVKNQQRSLRASNGTISDTCYWSSTRVEYVVDPRDKEWKYFCEGQFWDPICIDDDGYQWGFTSIWLWIFNGLLMFGLWACMASG
jgi:hypothetical protein